MSCICFQNVLLSLHSQTNKQDSSPTFDKLGSSQKNSFSHLTYTFIPTTNHFTSSEFESEGYSSVPGGVKLFAIGQGACSEKHNKKIPRQ